MTRELTRKHGECWNEWAEDALRIGLSYREWLAAPVDPTKVIKSQEAYSTLPADFLVANSRQRWRSLAEPRRGSSLS